MKRAVHCWLLATSILAPAICGCATFDLPEGYIKVEDQRQYDIKGVSPRGNAIALKTRPNEDASADLKFWTAAVEYQKVDLDGMKLVKRESIKSAHGIDGTLFQFGVGEGQAMITYLVALYVTPTRIHTIEAAGPEKAVAEEINKLRQAMLSLR